MEIYVWGTGCGAGTLLDTALPAERVAAFVEEGGKGSFLGRPVLPPEALRGREIDLVIVTVRDAEGAERRCRELGLESDRLFFLKNHTVLRERNVSAALAEQVLGKDYVQSISGTERLIRRPLGTEKERLPEEELRGDYVRLKTLELLCQRLEKVPGAAAELGVYRGDFARCIRLLLPERKLYLFDTFEGFDAKEAAGEGHGFVEAHRNTGPEAVMARMPAPEGVILRQGLFPASAKGLEERFALVSLDVDLEESSLQGLRWFWPRLSPGGCLLLHDWGNPRLPGVKRALDRLEEELGCRLPAVPLCDVCGTLVLTHP